MWEADAACLGVEVLGRVDGNGRRPKLGRLAPERHELDVPGSASSDRYAHGWSRMGGADTPVTSMGTSSRPRATDK
jgi:hypothetical protein